MTEYSTPLEKAIDERRRELRLRWKDVADTAGLSEETIRLVRRDARRGLIRTTRTEARLERALRWEPGSIQAVRDGDKAKPLSPDRHPTPDERSHTGTPGNDTVRIFIAGVGRSDLRCRICRRTAQRRLTSTKCPSCGTPGTITWPLCPAHLRMFCELAQSRDAVIEMSALAASLLLGEAHHDADAEQ